MTTMSAACRVLLIALIGVLIAGAPGHAASAKKDKDKIAELTALLQSADARDRASAAAFLLTSDDPAALRVLTDILKSKDGPAVISVIKAFGVKRDNRALKLILERLGDEKAEVREAAQETLGRLTAAEDVDTMTAFLGDAAKPAIARIMLAGALANQRALPAVPALIVLLEDRDEQVKQAGIAALEKITMQPLGNDAAAWRRWWLANRNKSRESLLEEIVIRQDEQLRTRRSQLAKVWIELLRKTGGNGGNAAGLAEALNSGVPEVAVFAAREMARLKPEGAVPALLGQLDNIDAGVRRAVVDALGEIGNAAVTQQLLARLDDADPDVQRAALVALGRLRAKEAVPRLIDLAGADKLKDEKLGVAAIAALGEIGDGRAVQPLAAVLAEAKRAGELREEAAVALGKLNDKGGLNALVCALGDKSDRLRWSAVDSLGRLGFPEAVPALAKVLAEDANAQVRVAAVVALGSIGTDDTVPPLLRAVRDVEGRVSEQALAAVVRIGKDRVEFFRTHADGQVQAGQPDVAAKLLGAAMAALRARNAAPAQLRALQEKLGEVYVAGEAWAKGGKVYVDLVQTAAKDDPKMAGYCDSAVKCLRAQKDYPGLLALAALARRQAPAQAGDWWKLTEDFLKVMLADGKAAKVIEAVDALAKDEADMGGEAMKARIMAIRKDAADAVDKEKAGKDTPAAGKPTAGDMDAIIADFARDEETRKKVVPIILMLGDKAVPALIQHGLASKNATVQSTTITTLEQITKHPFGITEAMTPEQRAQAVAAWIKWWQDAHPAPTPAPMPAPVAPNKEPAAEKK